VLVHREGTIILANRQAVALFGAESAAELIGRSVFTLVERESLARARARTAALNVAGARAELAELTYLRLDGTPFAVEAAAAAISLEGRLVIQVVFRDITARKRVEAALQARTAELETVLETVPVAVWLAHDPEARRITGNPSAARRLRLSTSDNQSKTAPEGEAPSHFRIFRDGREVPATDLPLQRAARGERVRNEELRILFDDGSFIDELMSATPIHDARGQVVGAVGAAVDISDRKAVEEQIRHLALHDPLTGLPNRRLFNDRLRQALARAERSGQSLAVMLLDLDQFKEVNDTLGHGVGDKLLSAVAARLTGIARAGDSWARLGGDEFALLQEGLESASGAIPVARRTLAALSTPFSVEQRELQIGASLGVTVFPDDGDTPEQLLRRADVALYRAKSAGRGRFERYRSELDEALHASRSLEQALRGALCGAGLALVYQPVFEISGRRLTKVEALLRWTQPDGRQVTPEIFIPVAEASGLIHEIGGWVLRAACRQAAAWQAGGQPLKVAVNVSPAQLRQAGFAASVEDALDDCGLSPALLELELTETVFLDPSKEQILGTLRQIAQFGVTLAIDDFGTGYSSLAYLKHFPFDDVKIDSSFVADIGTDAGGGTIASAVVALAHGLGKQVTAEGVETEAQLAFLRELGCDAAQGFLLGRPAPAEEVAHLLAKAA
jgi:diguanylate cyclase (GGDEF)-like protein/PAS domain S-box-containing protein